MQGWCRQRKRYDPSSWVPVWVTLYPQGDGGGGERSGAKWKALPVWPVDILDTKKSRSDFPMRVAVMLLSICRCKIKGKFKIESDTSRDLTDTLWLDGKRSKTKANVTVKKTERNNNALMDFGAFSHLKAFYGTYMVYF